MLHAVAVGAARWRASAAFLRVPTTGEYQMNGRPRRIGPCCVCGGDPGWAFPHQDRCPLSVWPGRDVPVDWFRVGS